MPPTVFTNPILTSLYKHKSTTLLNKQGVTNALRESLNRGEHSDLHFCMKIPRFMRY